MTCTHIETLSEIQNDYDAILCDLWGCYHDGITPYAAAVEACRGVRANGGKVILFTNAPRPAAQVKSFLERIGGPEDSYDAIVSSGAACQAALTSGQHGTKFYYLGPERDLHMLTHVGLTPTAEDEANAILCTGLVDEWNEELEDYSEQLQRLAGRGLPLLCANPDIVVDRGERRFWCAGALAQIYGKLGGEVLYFGKPHGPIYDRAFEVLAEVTGKPVAQSRVLAIGDGPATDVKGGCDYGLDTLFVTGGLAAGELGPDPERPDQALLDAYLAQHGLTPKYAIGKLR
ncbi:TIGR01459 family HAD-type hydrolase [Rhodobacteraceae bacterium NNCM2]|nr:TIGR01459 family HAD-type hydrolase [Coraliihabitans acroporae]